MEELITYKGWYERGRHYSHRGHPIFYQTGGRGGDGPALLLLHGAPTSSWDWHHLWPALCARYPQVIAADMLGFGYSAKPRDYDYTIADQADLQQGLLASLGVRHCHVLAHGYGDTVAQELLARQLERDVRGDRSLVLESVCLLNGGLFPETHRARRIQKLLLSPLGALLGAVMNERSFGQSFSVVFGPSTRPTADELHQFWLLIRHNQGNRNMHRLIRYMPERRANRERWVGALQQARIPLCVINGPLDPVSGAHMVERYRELVPNPDTHLLPGIGHYPQVEDPEGTLKALLAFQQRLAG
jgi:pimeloyl-ACP methyl ester carboxylesterase